MYIPMEIVICISLLPVIRVLSTFYIAVVLVSLVRVSLCMAVPLADCFVNRFCRPRIVKVTRPIYRSRDRSVYGVVIIFVARDRVTIVYIRQSASLFLTS